jgi:uncharacterized membrane protein
LNRFESEASSLSGNLVVKDKSFSKRFWAYASSLLCLWFFICGYTFYEFSGFRHNWHSNWDSTLRVRLGQTALSSSNFLFGAAIFCGLCALIYFVFGIVVRKPIAVLCGYVHLLMSVNLLFSATNYIRAITPVDPLEQLPGRFVSGFLTAQIFFLVYCVVGIFSPPPENEYVRLTGESP